MPKKLRTIKLDREFELRLKRAAYWSRTSVNAIIEEGAALLLARLVKEHNKGEDFPPTPDEQKSDE